MHEWHASFGSISCLGNLSHILGYHGVYMWNVHLRDITLCGWHISFGAIDWCGWHISLCYINVAGYHIIHNNYGDWVHFAGYVSPWMRMIVILPIFWATGVTVVFLIVSLILRFTEKDNTAGGCMFQLNIYSSSCEHSVWFGKCFFFKPSRSLYIKNWLLLLPTTFD